MFVLSLVLLLCADNDYALQCITNCSIEGLRFNQLLRIPDGQCQQRISASSCSVDLAIQYHKQTYSAQFDRSLVSRDFIYITSGPVLTYDVHYLCSKETNCVLSYAQNRVHEMVSRAYNTTHIYEQLASLIENPSRNDSIQCYNIYNENITCTSNRVCAMEYNQRTNKVKSRGCESNNIPRVFVYEGEYDSYFHVECAHNLCNNDQTYAKSKTIFSNNRLTDTNGGRIDAGTKEMSCAIVIVFALISVLIVHF